MVRHTITKVLTLIVVLVACTWQASAGTTRHMDYTFHGKPANADQNSKLGGAYNVVYITCEEDYCALNCFGGGDEECSWWNAGNAGGFDVYITNPQSLYQLGNADALFSAAEAQIDNGTHSGSLNAHVIKNSTTYYRTVSWNYNSTTGERNYTASITEVTP